MLIFYRDKTARHEPYVVRRRVGAYFVTPI